MRRDAAFRSILRLDATVDVRRGPEVLLLELVLHRVLHDELRACSCVGCQFRVQNSAELHCPTRGGGGWEHGERDVNRRVRTSESGLLPAERAFWRAEEQRSGGQERRRS
jgi:hypothetical protein